MSGYDPSGVIPVLEVPFHPDESIDVDGFASVVRHTIDAGADAVMFAAFASEFLKLSPGERADMERELLGICAPVGFPVVISVQQHATRLASAATASAVAAGASAINLLPPHQLRVGASQLRHHLTEVLTAAGDAPVILQYAPAETGTALDLEAVARTAEEFPNLWGVKVDASPAGPTIDALQGIAARIGRPFGATVGYAGLHLVDCVARGATAVQPGCSFTEIYVALWRELTAADPSEGVRLHRDVLPYLNHWMQSVELIVAVEKEISRRRGWFAASTVRQPGVALDDREHRRIDAFLAEFSPLLP
ncbi:MAG: dihydrodipicolinate synthase family protein [Actinobacteria bacterium]|nr:dihydrodipicolinate synthase family protein [Actinomycetota bacterium]